ncbi:MAG TPA: hypothetical protein VI423_11345 [Paenisporosarcina sp.]|nr:hypothetical protein [Paenisporosarcina sp.]
MIFLESPDLASKFLKERRDPEDFSFRENYADPKWVEENDPYGFYAEWERADMPQRVRVGPGEWVDEGELPLEEQVNRLHNVYLDPKGRDYNVHPDDLSWEDIPDEEDEEPEKQYWKNMAKIL